MMSLVRKPEGSEAARILPIYEELERVLGDYRDARAAWMDARVRHQSAREKFVGIRRLASEVLSSPDWAAWQTNHRDIEFMGLPIGEAIMAALKNKAKEAAIKFCEAQSTKEVFSPWLTLDEIVAALESGGMEFRTITPRREINAALLKLDGIIKVSGNYWRKDADKTLKDWAEWYPPRLAQDAAKNDDVPS